jgi:DHA1 family multidrug resistance protein-like MFS transporter
MSRIIARAHPSASEPSPAAEAPPRNPADPGLGWRRNVYALWVSQFTSIFGFSFALPFMPLFLSRELRITEPHQLALWTGLAAAGSGLGMAVASPVWGSVADRFGRKRMLVRAIIGGGLVLALTALVQNPPQLLGARVAMGVMAGTVGSTNALVAAETPRERVGWALGIIGSSVAIGRATGPLLGGLLGVFFDLRVVFLVGSLFCLAPVPIVMLLVRETQRPVSQAQRVSLRQALEAAGPGTVTAISALILVQALIQFSYLGGQNFAVLRVLQLQPSRAALATGVAFTFLGISTAIGALGSGSLTSRFGFKRSAVLAGMGMAVGAAGLGAASSLAVLVLAITVFGLAFGATGPITSSMLGLEAPAAVKATIFGFGASAIALGSTAGPLAAGGVAALTSISDGLYVCSAAAVVLAAIMALAAREPPKEAAPA